MGNEILSDEQKAIRRFLLSEIDRTEQRRRCKDKPNTANTDYFYAKQRLNDFYSELEKDGICICRGN